MSGERGYSCQSSIWRPALHLPDAVVDCFRPALDYPPGVHPSAVLNASNRGEEPSRSYVENQTRAAARNLAHSLTRDGPHVANQQAERQKRQAVRGLRC
jgi:hypothetical protein